MVTLHLSIVHIILEIVCLILVTYSNKRTYFEADALSIINEEKGGERVNEWGGERGECEKRVRA